MESIKELRRICQNPPDHPNPDSFLVHKAWRIFSIYLTRILLYTPFTPDHITMLMIFWGFLVGFFFSLGTYWYMLIGAIVFEFSFILDAVDGEMARYKKTSSLRGKFLDIVAHLTSTSIPFIGLTIGLYLLNPSIYVILAGLSAGVFSVLCLTVQSLKHYVMFGELIKYAQKTKKINQKRIHQKLSEKPIKKSVLKSLVKSINCLTHQAYMMQIFLLGAIFNKLYWILIFYSLIFPLMWLIKLIHEYKTGYKCSEYLLEPYKKK